MASRIRSLLGELPLRPVRRARLADADLLRYTGQHPWPPAALASLREEVRRWALEPPNEAALPHVLGLDAFAPEVCRTALDAPQRAMAVAALGSKRSLILAGRGSGKSHALGAIATRTAVCIPGAHVLVVAAADRQAREIAERVVMPMFAQDDRLFASICSSNQEIMELQRWRREQQLRAARSERVRRSGWGLIALYGFFTAPGALSRLIFGGLGPDAVATGTGIGFGLGTAFGAGAIILAAEHYVEFGRWRRA